MLGVELDLVVKDCLEALDLYERIFREGIARIEVTGYEKGMNEAVFTLYGTRLHLLDENPPYQLLAAKAGEGKPIWLNVTVENIEETLQIATESGCEAIQGVVRLEEFGVKNAIFCDPYGVVWMLHEIEREVSFEERKRILEEKMGLKEEKARALKRGGSRL